MTVHSTQSALVKDEGATSIHINIKINYQQSNTTHADGFEQQTAGQIVILEWNHAPCKCSEGPPLLVTGQYACPQGRCWVSHLVSVSRPSSI